MECIPFSTLSREDQGVGLEGGEGYSSEVLYFFISNSTTGSRLYLCGLSEITWGAGDMRIDR